MKLLENGLSWYGIKCVFHIHLQHHPIKMDIQSNSNIVHHHLSITPNYHTKLMKQQMKRKHISKLKT
jgi:hypothetical protein